MNIFKKRSIWVLIAIYTAFWLAASIVAGFILDGYKNTINSTLNILDYRTETLDTGEKIDSEYYKSAYVKKDANGISLTETDENGYEHQIYDDAALREASLAKADEVQREGATLLWNTSNGLPLKSGNKVSLFSHSSVDYVYSGSGSANARTNGAPTMKTALEAAGLSVNPTLWDFYKSGDGSSYQRTDRRKINEVPWSKYSSTVTDSFSQYGDAAIVVLSRRLGEGSVASGGALDATQTSADTASGDYFDMSSQEIKMLEEVIAAKKNRTFGKVIVLLNTPTALNFTDLMKYREDIDSCMWIGQGGWEGLNEVGRILAGTSVPSGHLPDTFAYSGMSAPAAVNSNYSYYTNANDVGLKNIGWQGTYLVYAENIYVGYKYYETRYEDAVLGQGKATSRPGAVNSSGDWVYGEEVAFPFGYSASYYGDFEYSNFSAERNSDGDYEVSVTVTNNGSRAGQDAVQVYVQKPYTDYDKRYGLEQASVNLAGYAKTGLIEPEDSETVKITVADDAFKTYDDENQKTYIREKTTGDEAYYITAASDAHAAVNNILAAKGKTPANTNGVMDAAGDASLTEKFTFTSDDFETYSVSESTGNPITNRFEDADWNKYENKTEATVTYLTRSDWEGTFPTTTPVLRMNKEMAADVGYDKEYPADPADEMPLYGQAHQFNLIDLKGLEYDHAAWETILNQLTLDEQIDLLAHASHGTPAIAHIAKPKETVEDCPMGVRKPYLTNSDGYTMSFPSNVLLAASYNNRLAREVGELMGEDMLHSGVTGQYGPSANLHRHTYGGRSFEYYSEDGYISGIMAKEQVVGMQSKGAYVNMKHFALNDQEDNRFGLCTFANEQSIREIYLEAFRPAVEDGGCTGMMSAFNRVGMLWSGAHRGLMTDVLRGEWGFEGFVVSDAAWRDFMGVVDGVMGGNDCILGENTKLGAYEAARTNPTIAKAIRESTHRILYTVVNSNAMNGISSNTRIYEVREWWQNLVLGIQIAVGCLTAAALVMTVLSFVFGRKPQASAAPAGGQAAPATQTKEEKIMKQEKDREQAHSAAEEERIAGEDVSGTPGGGGGKPPFRWTTKRIVTAVVSAVLALAVIGTAIGVPVAMMQGDPSAENPTSSTGVPSGSGDSSGGDSSGGDSSGTDKPSMADELGGDPQAYRFEAECGELVTDIEQCAKGLEGTLETCNYPSGDEYIMFLSQEGSATITYHITASEAQRAVLSVCIGIGTGRAWSQLFDVSVNGKSYFPEEEIVWPQFDETVHSVKWYDWLEQEVMFVDLQAGDNTIVFTKTTNGLNFDYFTLTSNAECEWTAEVENGGHTYSEWTVSAEPTLEEAGEAVSYCDTCRDKKSEVLPAISEENGYTLNVTKENSATTFGNATWTYDCNGEELTFDTLLYPTDYKESIRFECERMKLGGAGKIGESPIAKNPSGGAYADYISGNDTTVTLDLEADRATEALLIISFGCRSGRDIVFNAGRTLTVNGEVVEVGDDVVFYRVPSDTDWYNWQEYAVVVLSLQQGRNTISLHNDRAQFSCMDYYRFISGAELSWYVEE